MRIGTFNANKKLGPRSNTLRQLVQYASSNNYDVICLQEIGRKHDINTVNREVIGDYTLLLNCTTGTNLSESIGFLVRTFLVPSIDLRADYDFRGRMYHIRFKFRHFTFDLVSVYFPTALNKNGPDHPDSLKAFAMTDRLLEIFRTSRNMIVAGDFNEVMRPSDRSSGKVGNYFCRFLHRIVGQAGLRDLSARSKKHTCFRTSGSSKIDRILHSKSLTNRLSEFSVSDAPFLGSDHCLLSCVLSCRKPFKPKRDTPAYYRIRLDRLNDKQSKWFRREVCRSTHSIFQSLSSEVDSESFNHVRLNTYIKSFVEIVHSRFWEATRKLNPRPMTGTTGEDFLNGAVPPIQKPDLRKADKFPALSVLESRLQSLRRLKFDVSRSQALTSDHRTRLGKLDQRADIRLVSVQKAGKHIRSLIRDTEREIKKFYEDHDLTEDAERNKLFRSRRKFFNQRFIWNQAGTGGDLSMIFDDTQNRVVSDKLSVHSTLIREGGKLLRAPCAPPNPEPSWYSKLYRPGSRIAHLKAKGFTWDGLMADFTFSEIYDAACCKPDSAPGFDCVDKKILRHLFRDDSGFTVVMQYVSLLLKTWVNLGATPSWFSKGLVCLMKKPGKETATDYKSKRPITLLPDIAKIALKIYADRLQQYFLKWDILDKSQAGFLLGMGCDKPLHFLFDTIRRCNAESKELLAMFLDISKAFDKIQHHTIEATLRRFDLPEVFIDFLMSYYRASKSAFRTAWGRTKFFDLQNSVRQGCPISPLIFVMVMDGFHSYMRDLNRGGKMGFRWGFDLEREEITLGLADDTAGLSHTVAGIATFWRQTLEFFNVHGWKINASKTEARYNRAFASRPGAIKSLRSLAVWGTGVNRVIWRGPEIGFRYLGIICRLDLDVRSHIEFLESKKLNPILRAIKCQTFTFQQAITTYREVVCGILSWSAKFYSFPDDFTDKWTKAFYQEFCRLSGMTPGHILKPALFYLMNCFNVDQFCALTLLSETFIYLNSFESHWYLSSRIEAIRDPRILSRKRYDYREPLCNIGIYAKRYNAMIYKNHNYNGDPTALSDAFIINPRIFSRRQPRILDPIGAVRYSDNFDTFTTNVGPSTTWRVWSDGSAKDGNLGWGIGIWRDDKPNEVASACGGFNDRFAFGKVGHASVAEAIGSLAGFLATKAGGHGCANYTDCRSTIMSSRRFNSGSQRARLRTKCRPAFRAIGHLRKQFSEGIIFCHTPGHQTQSANIVHKRNVFVDKLAREGRELASSRNFRLDLSWWDYPFGFSLGGAPVISDPMADTKEYFRHGDMKLSQMTQWRGSDGCGRLVKHDETRVRALLRSKQCSEFRYDPFFFDMLITNYPNGQLLSLKRDFLKECSICNCGGPDDDEHFLTCPALIHDRQFKIHLHHIMRLSILRNSSSLKYIGAYTLNILRKNAQKAKDTLSRLRRDLSDRVLNGLLFSFFLDLGQIGEVYDENVLTFAVRNLPGSSCSPPVGTRVLTSSEVKLLEGDTRVPMDLVVLLSIAHLPRYFHRWSAWDNNPDRCALRFGEIRKIEQSHRDMTVFFVFTSLSTSLRNLMAVVGKRLTQRGRTWIISELNVNMMIPGIETQEFTVGQLKVTCIRPNSLKLRVPRSGLSRALKSFDSLTKLDSISMAFPFLGLGKLSSTIELELFPADVRPLIFELRSTYGPDFILGFFKPRFANLFDSHSRSLLRKDLIRVGIPLIKYTHTKRLHYYKYLRSGFNFFTRPVVKLKNQNPNKRGRQFPPPIRKRQRKPESHT